MRELKFRAWDKKSKKMRDINSIAFNGKDISAINLWGKNIIEDKDIILRRTVSECIVMQYTGYKDKNEKEIYEGDVVLIRENIEEKGNIVWDSEQCDYVVDAESFEIKISLSCFYQKDIEIVGIVDFENIKCEEE